MHQTFKMTCYLHIYEYFVILIEDVSLLGFYPDSRGSRVLQDTDVYLPKLQSVTPNCV